MFPKEVADKLHDIFFPKDRAARARLNAERTRFVHYTSATAALKIIQNKEIWMRKTFCMNDYSEVEHGLNCLFKAYNGDEVGLPLRNKLDELLPGTADLVKHYFDSALPAIRYETFLTCLSEHRDDEDRTGRLSMWRAYGEDAGIAIVFKNEPFLEESKGNGLKAYFMPVNYTTDSDYGAVLRELTAKIEHERDFLIGQGKEWLALVMTTAFRFAAISMKHPGFQEEKEWRVVYCPSLEKSNYMREAIETIRGVPQQIKKIPLENFPDAGIVNVEIPSILDRIIIGPSQFPLAMYEAFVELLRSAKVPNPESRVFISDLPLRR